MQILKSNICKYQFGVRVPRNIAEAYKLDQENGNYPYSEWTRKEGSVGGSEPNKK